jgi:hypothetical protein
MARQKTLFLPSLLWLLYPGSGINIPDCNTGFSKIFGLLLFEGTKSHKEVTKH